jgi:diaminopimelate decarboxylase
MNQPLYLINLTQHLPTPFLVIDQDDVRRNIQRIRRALPQVELFYAVKCNADRRVLEAVRQTGSGFEIASISEAELMSQLGAPAESVVCLHPVKAPDFLRELRGGLPAPYETTTLALEKIGEVVGDGLSRIDLSADCTVSIEPGRAVVASA